MKPTEIICPACKKANQLLPAEPLCSRCRSDLSRLLAIQVHAGHRLSRAKAALQQSDWETALSEATLSWQSLHTPRAAQVAFLAAVALGDRDLAMTWFHLQECPVPNRGMASGQPPAPSD